MKKKNRASVSSKPIKMTDAELSKKLGHYQAMSVIWFWVGVVGAVSGAIFYLCCRIRHSNRSLWQCCFWRHFCASFFSGGAQKKLKVLMQEQMGDFFPRRVGKGFRAGYPHPGNVH